MGLPVGLGVTGMIANCFGGSLAGWAFPALFGLGLAVMMKQGRRSGVLFAAVEGLILLLTGFSCSYDFGDSSSCWFPMQQMMREGWNPVWAAGLSDVRAALDGYGAAANHILVYPKFPSLVGAVVGRGVALFSADAYLPCSLAFVLWSVSARFAKRQWQAPMWAAQAFAASIVVTTKLTGAFVGYVDYSVYAALMIALLAGWLWREDGGAVNRIEHVLALLVLGSVKANGLLFAIVAMIGLIAVAKRGTRRSYLLSIAVVGAGWLILNVNPIVPYVREFLLGGRAWLDLTTDFGGNEDALRMGRVARMAYAWISPSVVPGRPEFEVLGGVAGFGGWFNALMGLSVAALVWSRDRAGGWLVLVLFVSANVLPLKYVGYSRYCPQMWAIPSIALFATAFSARLSSVRSARLPRLARGLTAGALAAVALALAIRDGRYYAKNVRLEFDRRKVIAGLVASGGAVRLADELRTGVCGYAISRRLMSVGLTVARQADVCVDFDRESRKLVVEP